MTEANTALKTEDQYLEDGWYNMTNEQYHSSPAVSKSDMSKILDCPRRYIQPGIEEEKDNLIIGAAFHTAVLEPDKFDREYVTLPDDCRPGSGRGQRDRLEAFVFESQQKGQTILKPEWVDQIRIMRDAVHMHPTVRREGLLEGGEAEISGFYFDTDFGIHTKIRPDYLKQDRPIIVDLKSAADPTPRKFGNVAYDKDYDLQTGHYSYTAMKLTGIMHEGFYFIAVEKPKLKGQYVGVLVYRATPEFINNGLLKRSRALTAYAECRKDNSWPGYDETIQELNLPGWITRKPDLSPIFD